MKVHAPKNQLIIKIPCVRRWAIVIQTLTPSGLSDAAMNTRSICQIRSEYSRPEVMPIHNKIKPRLKPTFQLNAVHTPSFSDHSLVLPKAGVMYIMVMANAIEILPKITASTCTCRMCPKEKISTPVTKSGNASLAALNEPRPVPITNQKIAEKPKYIVAVPGGISSCLAKRYLSSIVVTSPL